MNLIRKTSYDNRNVRYENIHHLTPQQFDALSGAIMLENGDRMLDAGCGYGSATREIIVRNKDKQVHYHLLDQSALQLNGAKKELAPFEPLPLSFFNMALMDHPFKANSFQKILVKKVIHEFPKERQEAVLAALYNLLAPGGLLLVWQNVLDDKSQPFFQSVMMKKDELAGFDTMVRNRHFPSEAYFFECAAKAGFDKPKKHFEFDYHVQTTDRLESELHGDVERLEKWNAHLRELVAGNDGLKQHLFFEDEPEKVGFTVKNAIYSLKKQQ